jgi:hypothetical protein
MVFRVGLLLAIWLSGAKKKQCSRHARLQVHAPPAGNNFTRGLRISRPSQGLPPQTAEKESQQIETAAWKLGEQQ